MAIFVNQVERFVHGSGPWVLQAPFWSNGLTGVVWGWQNSGGVLHVSGAMTGAGPQAVWQNFSAELSDQLKPANRMAEISSGLQAGLRVCRLMDEAKPAAEMTLIVMRNNYDTALNAA